LPQDHTSAVAAPPDCTPAAAASVPASGLRRLVRADSPAWQRGAPRVDCAQAWYPRRGPGSAHFRAIGHSCLRDGIFCGIS
jgi:hypothetical protein